MFAHLQCIILFVCLHQFFDYFTIVIELLLFQVDILIIELIINFDMTLKRIFVILSLILIVCSTSVETIQQDMTYQFDFLGCGKGCLNCTQTQCLKCDDNGHWEDNKGKDCKCMQAYYEQKQKCLQCIEGCKVCAASTTCQICFEQKHYHLVDNTTCQCMPFYFNSNKACLSCMAGCEECTELATCKKCHSSFYTEHNICKCADGKYVQGNQCLECEGQCATCLNKDICKSCKQGYDLDGDVCKQAGGFSTLVIILIAVGEFLLVTVIGGTIFYCLKKKKSSSPLQEQGQYEPLS